MLSDDRIQKDIRTRYTHEEVYKGNRIRGTNRFISQIRDIGQTVVSID